MTCISNQRSIVSDYRFMFSSSLWINNTYNTPLTNPIIRACHHYKVHRSWIILSAAFKQSFWRVFKYSMILCETLDCIHASEDTYSDGIMLKHHPSNDVINLMAPCLYNERFLARIYFTVGEMLRLLTFCGSVRINLYYFYLI